jgi:hypothetical protein
MEDIRMGDGRGKNRPPLAFFVIWNVHGEAVDEPAAHARFFSVLGAASLLLLNPVNFSGTKRYHR